MAIKFGSSHVKSLLLNVKKQIKKILFKSKFLKVGSTPSWEPETILLNSRDRYKLSHVAAYVVKSNAGDILLPAVLRDLFVDQSGGIDWQSLPVYESVTPEIVEKINQSQGLIIGGGGLFLCDTNKNSISGWQWPCSIEHLNSIKVPICVFAVGYNRFRGQEEFEDFFTENLRALANKSVYIGLRNTGSIQAIRNYLPLELHSKVIFQPCMTTFISLLYPDLFTDLILPDEPFIALNCAFDRAELRFGDRKKTVLEDIAKGVLELTRKTGLNLKYYSHFEKDIEMVEVLKSYISDFEVCDLSQLSPREIIAAYRTPSLVLGMRGHAQMIPFGCQTPIISLVSHNKLKWFLDDINQPGWSVDLTEDNIKSKIVDKGLEIIKGRPEVIEIIQCEQKKLWDISRANVKTFFDSLSTH